MTRRECRDLVRGSLLWALGPLVAAMAVGGTLWILLGPASLKVISRERSPDAVPQGSRVGATDGISLALVPERNVFEQRRRYRPLCEYLSQRLGVPVRIKWLRDYDLVLSEIVEGRVDTAFLGSFTYALADAGRCTGHSPTGLARRQFYLLRPSVRAGRLRHQRRGVVKGKVLAMVNRDMTGGYLFPLVYFRRHGVDDIERHFSRVYYAGTHDLAAMVVFRGEGDLGAAKNHQYEELFASMPAFARQMKVIARSADMPSNRLAIRRGLPARVVESLQAALLSLHEDPQGLAALRALGASSRPHMRITRTCTRWSMDSISTWRVSIDPGRTRTMGRASIARRTVC